MSCYIFDFTLKAEGIEFWEVQEGLDNLCKKYVFQLERGGEEWGPEEGYRHYQGRVSLHKKVRKEIAIKYQPWKHHAHWSVTSRAGKENSYALKMQTRIDGPWYGPRVKAYIPRQIRGITLRPWQQQLKDMAKDLSDDRKITCIYDPVGNIGKSVISMYLRCYELARFIPALNDSKDLMQCVCSMPTSTAYIADLPRAMPKTKLKEFYSALEIIRGGYAFDTRYKFSEKIFDPPRIFVFTNVLPDMTLLSRDRWDILTVEDNHLTKFLVEALPGVDLCNN